MTQTRKHHLQNFKKKTAPLNLSSNRSSASENTLFQLNTHYFLFFLMAIVFLGCFSIIRPYIHTILLAAILSFVASPVHRRIENRLGNRRNLSAFMSCLLLTIVVVIPLMFLLLSLIQQGISSFNAMYDWIAAGKYRIIMEHPLTINLYAWINEQLPDIRKIFPDLNLAGLEVDKLVMETFAGMGKALLNQGGKHRVPDRKILPDDLHLFLSDPG